MRKYLAGQDTRLGKQVLKGKKNIAVGEVKLGEDSYSLQAVSGETDPEGFTKFVPNEERYLKTGGAGKYIRDVDSEAKILEQTMRMTNRESHGTIRIFTEKEPCEACKQLFENFHKHRPGMDIEIYWKGGGTTIGRSQ